MGFDSELQADLLTGVRSAVAERFPAAIAKLAELVRIPGIAWESFDAQQLELSATAVQQSLLELGLFDFVDIRRSKTPSGALGAPAVLARRAGAPDAPHVLLYAHHDVQPPGNSADWTTEPFELTLVGDRLYGRGASDDKAGIVTHLTALAVLAELAELRIGLTVFIEGEEEAGSPSFQQFLQDNRDDLAADLIIVADSGNIDTQTASLTTGLRGLVSQVVTVRTLDHAVHSGMFSGPVPDAMMAMIRLLAQLHNDRGDLAVSGLSSIDNPVPAYPEAQFRAEAGVLPGVELIGSRDFLSQNWFTPSITVIGIDYPAVAVSSNTMHPSVSAKVSMRIAPGENPERALELLRDHLRATVPFGAELEFGETELGSGYLAKSGWAERAASKALELAWGKPQQPIAIGGSIPFIATLAAVFPQAEILVTGVEDPDSRAHSPNESQHIETLRRAIEAESMLLLHGNALTRD